MKMHVIRRWLGVVMRCNSPRFISNSLFYLRSRRRSHNSIHSSLLRPALSCSFLPYTYSKYSRSLLRASEVSYSYSITFAPYTHSSYGWAYHCALFTYHSPHFPFWKCCQLKMHSPNRKTAGHLLHNAKQRLANICRALKIFRFEARY